MLQIGDTVSPRYTAPKISAISCLFRTFSLLIMGDTERPRYTGFRGLSVRGITALQCTLNNQSLTIFNSVEHERTVDSRFLDLGYLEQPLISKRKSGPY